MKVRLPQARAAVPSLAILIVISAVGPFGDTEYTPSLPTIAHDMDVSYASVQLTMTFYLVGYAFSQLCYGPLSDRWGRRPWMLFGSVFFLGGSIACMLAESLSFLIIGRVIQSVGSCAGGVLSNAVVRDAFPAKERSGMYAKINAAMAVAPGLGPVAGSFIDTAFGWHANFLLLVILAVIMLVGVSFWFPETNKNLDPAATKVKPLLKHILTLVKHRTYLPYLVVAGLCMGLVYAILVEAPALVVHVLHLPSTYLSIVGVAVMFGFIFGSLLSTHFSRKFDEDQLIMAGLCIMIVGCLALTLFVVAKVITFATLLTPIAEIFVGIAFVVPNTAAKALAPFEKITGIASSVMGAVSMGLAAVGTMLMGFWHAGYGAVDGVVYNFWSLTLAATVIFVLFIMFPRRRRESASRRAAAIARHKMR